MICKILIVDDSVVIRRLVRTCIQSNTDWQVCGEAENGQVAVPLNRPLIVAIDILNWTRQVGRAEDASNTSATSQKGNPATSGSLVPPRPCRPFNEA